jgi:PAS domain S-box-containing protein
MNFVFNSFFFRILNCEIELDSKMKNAGKNTNEPFVLERIIKEQMLKIFRFSRVGIQLFQFNGDKLILRGANNAADEILEVKHQQMIRKPVKNPFNDNGDSDTLNNYIQVAKDGQPWCTERINCKAGKNISAFQVFVFQITDKMIVAAYTDITERKKNESELKSKTEECVSLIEKFHNQNKTNSDDDKELDDKIKEILNVINRLEQNEERQALALEATNDGVWDYNPLNNKTYFSPRWYNMLGYKKDEFSHVFDTFLNLVFKEDREYVRRIISSFLKSGETYFSIEFRMNAKDGMVRWIQSRGKSVESDGNGNILRVIGTHTDITDRKLTELAYQQQNEALKNAEAKLLAINNELKSVNKKLESQNRELHSIYKKLVDSEEKFRQLAENSKDIFWLRNKKEILYLNCAFEIISGRSGEELKKNPDILLRWIHPEDDTKFNKWPADDKLLKNNRYEEQFRIIRPDGEVRWIWARYFPVFNKNKEFYRLAGIASDVTEQKSVEQELRIAKLKAQESDRLKTTFLANISHEIRTPMNGIVGFAEMINQENVEPEVKKEYENIISLSSQQLLNIIDDIIDISKIEANQLTIDKSVTNINELLSELHLFYERQFLREGKSDIELSVYKELSDEESNIDTDHTRLRQILCNLINNAVKFTSRGSIKFGYTINEDKYMQFFVEDTGIGIDEELFSTIFEYFRQADEGNTRAFGGIGLGLPIAKGLTGLLGGEIWVESRKGIGSKFYFTHPYRLIKKEKKTPEIKAEPEIYNWHDKVVLIVEDDELNYAFLKAVISQTNATTMLAQNGYEAIDICKSKAPDIILLDIRLPEMDGYEATRQLRKMNMNIPIIAQTAYAMTEDKIKCLNAGCNDYIAKPLNKDELLIKMNKLLK